MTDRDVNRVWAMEQDLFAAPWPKTSFMFEVSDSRVSYPITALENDEIVGYAVAWFISDELHIGNIAVARHKQGRGIGKQILEHMLKEASARKIFYASLEVRVSNVKAIALYRRYGFKGIAFRERYYSDNGEDALVMLLEMKQGDWDGRGGSRGADSRGHGG